MAGFGCFKNGPYKKIMDAFKTHFSHPMLGACA